MTLGTLFKFVSLLLIRQLETAATSQSTNKREGKLEASGANRCQDIRIENFDLSFGERYAYSVN